MPRIYKEGKAAVYNGAAFINSAAKLTRDIGVAIAELEKRPLDIIDPTAATGIRGIRYCLEVRGKSCTMLEINSSAYNTLLKNVEKNGVAARALNIGIQEFANTSRERFDLIDLDPFGGVAPYVYDLLKLARANTLFFVTATDTAVLCGAHRRACLRLYSAEPMHNELCKEVGLRILLGYMARLAAQFDFGIEPLLSMNYKHYMRLHLRLRHGAESAADSMKRLGYFYYCNKCRARGAERGLIPATLECSECGGRLQLAGPLWAWDLHDKNTVELASKAVGAPDPVLMRLEKELDTPLIYSIPKTTKALGIKSVSPQAVIKLLQGKGRAASLAHFDPSYVRTYAGVREVEEAVEKVARLDRTAEAQSRSSAIRAVGKPINSRQA